MKKVLVFLVLIIIAILLASLFGVVHDQISFTISSEYYTKFKFQQFGLLENSFPLPTRFLVGVIGVLASWWMGLLIGIFVGAAGFMHGSPRRMFFVTLRSFLLVIGCTLLVGLLGLAYGYFRTQNIDLANYAGWRIPPGIEQLRCFLCVGYMHNASYLGGALSILAAWIYHFKVRTHASP